MDLPVLAKADLSETSIQIFTRSLAISDGMDMQMKLKLLSKKSPLTMKNELHLSSKFGQITIRSSRKSREEAKKSGRNRYMLPLTTPLSRSFTTGKILTLLEEDLK